MRNTIREYWWAINNSGLGLYLVGLAFLGVMSLAGDRLLSDRLRTSVLTESPQPLQQRLSGLGREKQPPQADPVSSEAPWTAHIGRMDDALAQNDVRAATEAWRKAYGAALASRRWEGLVAVGDASLRIGGIVEAQGAPKAKARRLYLAALFRARDQRSLDGVLRATGAFAALGDRQVVNQGLRIAEDLATQGQGTQSLARLGGSGVHAAE